LHSILRDRSRMWRLASIDGASRPYDALEPGPASRILPGLLRGDGNLQAIRGMLRAEYPFTGRPIPARERALLAEIQDRLLRRRWALLPGPEIDLRAALTRSTRAGAGRTQTLRIFDLSTGDFAEASVTESPPARDAIPALRFSGGHERTDWIGYRHTAGREPGFAFSNGGGNGPVPDFAPAAESGQALGFTHAAEPPLGSG
jgi:hypothetical protein